MFDPCACCSDRPVRCASPQTVGVMWKTISMFHHGAYPAGDLSTVIRHAVGLVCAVTGVMVMEGRTRVPS